MDALALLITLGLNQLEAETYLYLLTHDQLTGYRIAQALGKPSANVYKALEALARKGAVVMEEGESRACRAVPMAEFLSHLEASFQETASQLTHMSAQLKAPLSDERIYQIQSPALVFERCRRMLARCRTIAVIDIFPHAFSHLQEAIQMAAQRGIEVYLQVYAPVEMEMVHLVRAYDGQKAVEYWQSEQINVVIDGQEVLLALMNPSLTKVEQAIWSQSLYLACMLHAGFMKEHTIHQLMALQAQDAPVEEMRQVLLQHKHFHTSSVPGQQALFRRFAPSDPESQK